jgi:hypothetical protein
MSTPNPTFENGNPVFKPHGDIPHTGVFVQMLGESVRVFVSGFPFGWVVTAERGLEEEIELGTLLDEEPEYIESAKAKRAELRGIFAASNLSPSEIIQLAIADI